MNFLQGFGASRDGCAHGHRAASREHTFRAIYEQHGPAVHAYVARRVAADAYVEDLVSETFMVAWRKLPKDVEEPLPWLYAVARREVRQPSPQGGGRAPAGRAARGAHPAATSARCRR